MARRSTTSSKTAPTKPVEAPDEVQEDTVSTETVAPEASTAPTAAPSEVTPVDLTAFKQAAEKAVAEKDTSTGQVPLAAVEPVLKEYRAIDGIKGKNAAKAWLQDQMKKAMDPEVLDVQTARAFLELTTAMTAGGSKSTAERTPSDPTEAFVQRVGGLRLALQLASENVPEGVAEDWKDKASTLVNESADAARKLLAFDGEGEAPEVSAFVKAAVKLAQGKAAKVGGRSGGTRSASYTGERRNIAKHIQAAFEDKKSGDFLTVAQIRAHKSEEYGDDLPSAGAISIRLFPKNGGKCSVEGVIPDSDDSGHKGARKA